MRQIKQTHLMSKMQEKVCMTLNHIGNLITLLSTITKCVSISVFATLLGVPKSITTSEKILNICAITAAIKKYQSIIKKKEIRKYSC